METKKVRLFRGSTEIQRLLQAYDQSNLSVTEFCAVNNIPKGSFNNWKNKYTKAAQVTNDKPGFARLHISSPSAASLFAEVGDIRIYQPVSAAYLKELQR